MNCKRKLLPRHSTLSVLLQGLQSCHVNNATTRLHCFIWMRRMLDPLSSLISTCLINDWDYEPNVIRQLTLLNKYMCLCTFKITARWVWCDQAQQKTLVRSDNVVPSLDDLLRPLLWVIGESHRAGIPAGFVLTVVEIPCCNICNSLPSSSHSTRSASSTRREKKTS